jgi:hypothetical protein
MQTKKRGRGRMQKRQSLIAISLCVLIGLGCFLFLHLSFYRYRQLKEKGIETEAQVTRIFEKKVAGSENKINYQAFIDYSFEDQNGRPFTGGHFLSKEQEKALADIRTVSVTYLPSDPSINQMTESLEWKGSGTVFVGIMYGLIGFCIIGLVVNVKNLF